MPNCGSASPGWPPASRSPGGGRAFDYGAGQFVVITVDLPLTSHVSAASDAEPFAGVSLPLHAPTVADLLLESRLPAQAAPDGPAMSVSDATPDLIDAFVRLLRLAGSPADARVLAPAVRREIHWRLLTGPQGGLVSAPRLAWTPPGCSTPTWWRSSPWSASAWPYEQFCDARIAICDEDQRVFFG